MDNGKDRNQNWIEERPKKMVLNVSGDPWEYVIEMIHVRKAASVNMIGREDLPVSAVE